MATHRAIAQQLVTAILNKSLLRTSTTSIWPPPSRAATAHSGLRLQVIEMIVFVSCLKYMRIALPAARLILLR